MTCVEGDWTWRIFQDPQSHRDRTTNRCFSPRRGEIALSLFSSPYLGGYGAKDHSHRRGLHGLPLEPEIQLEPFPPSTLERPQRFSALPNLSRLPHPEHINRTRLKKPQQPQANLSQSLVRRTSSPTLHACLNWLRHLCSNIVNWMQECCQYLHECVHVCKVFFSNTLPTKSLLRRCRSSLATPMSKKLVTLARDEHPLLSPSSLALLGRCEVDHCGSVSESTLEVVDDQNLRPVVCPSDPTMAWTRLHLLLKREGGCWVELGQVC